MSWCARQQLDYITECPLHRSRGLQPGKRHHPSQEFAKQKLMENNGIYLLTSNYILPIQSKLNLNLMKNKELYYRKQTDQTNGKRREEEK